MDAARHTQLTGRELITRHELELVGETIADIDDAGWPIEVWSLVRGLGRWRDQIIVRYVTRISDRPTEAVINLIMQGKREAFGPRSVLHYRVCSLIYAGFADLSPLDPAIPR